MDLFEWDKYNLEHIALHAVTASEAEEVLLNNPSDVEVQFVEGEERIVQLGETRSGRILRVVSTERRGKIRIVSAPDASRRSKLLYNRRRHGATT